MEETTWETEAASSLWLCGIDEAGRGPLAGPVCAAAVILPPDFPREALADSKVLSARKREYAASLIRERARAWAIGWAGPIEIDRINILQATMRAMERAYALLGVPSDLVLVDGNRAPNLPVRSRTVVRGDSKVPEIMAASILAKTSRDRVMERYDWLYPEYGYGRHKGYPTSSHRRVCLELGPSPIQRLSFAVRSPE